MPIRRYIAKSSADAVATAESLRRRGFRCREEDGAVVCVAEVDHALFVTVEVEWR